MLVDGIARSAAFAVAKATFGAPFFLKHVREPPLLRAAAGSVAGFSRFIRGAFRAPRARSFARVGGPCAVEAEYRSVPSSLSRAHIALSVALALSLASQSVVDARATTLADFTIVDLVELEIAFSTLSEQYYRTIPAQTLLDGARVGMIAYLRGRGIANPIVGTMHARSDGRGAVAIEQQLARAIERYGTRINIREFIYATIRGEIGSLHDPYSVFLTKSELAKFSRALDGETFGGIGIVLGYDEAKKLWKVENVVDDGPAAKAGVQSGDAIDAVDGVSTAGLSVDRMTHLLRGKPGTTVRLSVTRSATALAPMAIVRAIVNPPDVSSRMLPGEVGYIALHVFGSNAGREVHTALAQLEAKGARAVIFDLRGNGGGYEVAAVKVAANFVATGPIVAIAENHGKRRITHADGTAPPPRPLVVLVNHDSASGSELVTAALQDRGVAKVIGTRTFGKGLVQSMFPLPDGSAVKVTTARYFSPSGRDINGVGVAPDITVEEPGDAVLGTPGRDPQLDRALTELAAATPPATSQTP